MWHDLFGFWGELVQLAVFVVVCLVLWARISLLYEQLEYTTEKAEKAYVTANKADSQLKWQDKQGREVGAAVLALNKRLVTLDNCSRHVGKTVFNQSGKLMIQREEIDSINSRLSLAADFGAMVFKAILNAVGMEAAAQLEPEKRSLLRSLLGRDPDVEQHDEPADETDGVDVVARVTGISQAQISNALNAAQAGGANALQLTYQFHDAAVRAAAVPEPRALGDYRPNFILC